MSEGAGRQAERPTRSGGQVVVAHLAALGVKRLFTVPAESFLTVLDALHDDASLGVIVCRHEGGAAMMAEATARIEAALGNPQPGIAIVGRGPGLANAMSGLHVAMQAGTPLLLLVGLPPTRVLGRGGFQDVAVEPLTGNFAKWAATVTRADRLPEMLRRATIIALAGRPGPVVLGLPEDVLSGEIATPGGIPAASVVAPSPSWSEMQALIDAIEKAEWPLVIAGGLGWTETASAELAAFAARFDLPVIASFRSQDVIDNRHPCYVGHAGRAMAPRLSQAVRSADLIIAVGTQLDETTADGYRALGPEATTSSRIIHVHPAPEVIGQLMPATAIVSGVSAFTSRLADLAPSVRAGTTQRWSTLRRDLRTAFLAWQRYPASPGALRLEDVIHHMNEVLPGTAIITNGAGNYAAFLHRSYTWKASGTQLAPLSGSMGYGLPAAIAAKLAAPDREVICLAGDGCFQMTAQELATAAQYALPIIVIVANNGILGTIRAEQEQRFPGRVVGTSLVNPDFAAQTRAAGLFAARVLTIAEFEAAFAQSRQNRGPSLIELTLDPEAIAPGKKLHSS